jgi:hypothetical protein
MFYDLYIINLYSYNIVTMHVHYKLNLYLVANHQLDSYLCILGLFSRKRITKKTTQAPTPMI